VTIVTSPLTSLVDNQSEFKATGEAMVCKRCASENQSTFNGEVAIHFPGPKGLDKPIVWLFPKLVVCLDCGFTEFSVPEAELRRLVDGAAAAA
jgi:hypothetical protein